VSRRINTISLAVACSNAGVFDVVIPCGTGAAAADTNALVNYNFANAALINPVIISRYIYKHYKNDCPITTSDKLELSSVALLAGGFIGLADGLCCGA